MVRSMMATLSVLALFGGTALAQSSDPSASPGSPPAQLNPGQPAPEGSGGQPGSGMGAAPGQGSPVIPEEAAEHLRAKKLIGSAVFNAEGEQVGKVDDIVFDDQGRLVGVVVNVGGFFGIGGKPVAIAAENAALVGDEETQRQVVQVNMTRQDLEQAPEFKTKEQQEKEAQDAATEAQMEQPAAPADQ